jgi:hypothetical protein
MTERYRRTDYGHMEFNVTFEDTQTFAKPYLKSSLDTCSTGGIDRIHLRKQQAGTPDEGPLGRTAA